MIVGPSVAGLARGRISLVGLVRIALEPLLIVVCLIGACLVNDTTFGGPELVLAILAFSLTFPGEVSVRRLHENLAVTIAVRWLLVIAMLVFIGYATRSLDAFDAAMLWTWVGATPVVLYAAHRAIPSLVPQLLAIEGCRSAVVVAANDVGRKLARHLRDEAALGYRFVGFFDAQDRAVVPAEGPMLGTIDAAPDYIKRHAIDTVFVALPMAAQPEVVALLDSLKDTTASIYFVPDIFISDLIQARIDDVHGMPVVAVCETPISGVNVLVKRTSDVVVSAVALAVAAPLMLLIALAIKLSSPGPALFRQRRYGLDGREIVVWKFRSMRVAEDGAQITQARRDDPRITPLGALLRRTSLDELPQLFNVLRGTMSMVGPRPHAVAHNEQYRRLIKGYMLRHKVKPGITGWAQVNGCRGETQSIEQMKARVDYDIDYLRRWSLGFDLMILVKTVQIVLRGTNAY